MTKKASIRMRLLKSVCNVSVPLNSILDTDWPHSDTDKGYYSHHTLVGELTRPRQQNFLAKTC